MKARGTVLKPPLGIFLSPCDPATFRPQVPRTQISRPESPGMTSPSPRIQIISTDSAVASPQRIQVPAPVPLGTSHLPKGFNKELCFLGIKYNIIYSLRNKIRKFTFIEVNYCFKLLEWSAILLLLCFQIERQYVLIIKSMGLFPHLKSNPVSFFIAFLTLEDDLFNAWLLFHLENVCNSNTYLIGLLWGLSGILLIKCCPRAVPGT